MRRLQHILLTAVFSSAMLAAAACGSIFDNDLDCTPKIRFVFKKHRQALQAVNGNPADVFGSTVGSVHVFVYNAENGKLVMEKTESTQNLMTETQLGIGTGSEHCLMELDLDPGQYKIVAWCGLDDSDQNNAFALAKDTRAAQPATDYDLCSVKLAQDGRPVNTQKYESVYHGVVASVAVEYNNATVIPVELTKDNNDIAVWVQHTSATFAPGDYYVVYTDANGSMRFDDNSIADNRPLEYHAHTTSILNTETEYNGSKVEAGALIAHISTSRLMAANRRSARLEVKNRQGETLFSIPLIQYLLEMQTFTNDGQYYLDCEDTYNCSFYLSGENEFWTAARIIINNWVRVPNQNDTIGQ